MATGDSMAQRKSPGKDGAICGRARGGGSLLEKGAVEDLFGAVRFLHWCTFFRGLQKKSGPRMSGVKGSRSSGIHPKIKGTFLHSILYFFAISSIMFPINGILARFNIIKEPYFLALI